ncbi:MAG: EVE domain-containing protein [Fimbriimonadaceae bacterium]
MRYWLMKSEPETYGIDHLIAEPNQTGMWEGCRNYTVRNFIRDDMSIGDLAFFYHSNANPSGVVGIMEVVSDPYPDPTQWDPKSHYYDPKSPKDNPRWLVRDMKFFEKFPRTVSLAELKAAPGLEDMMVTRKGMRLSITPVSAAEWAIVVKLANQA